MSHAEFWGLQLPLYRYWRISLPTLEVDIAAIKEGRRSTSVHSFVTPNKQMNRQYVRRVISYRFAMRTVLGGTVLALPLEHVGGKKSVFIFEFVVQAFLLEGRQQKEVAAARTRGHAMSFSVARSLNSFAVFKLAAVAACATSTVPSCSN